MRLIASLTAASMLLAACSDTQARGSRWPKLAPLADLRAEAAGVKDAQTFDKTASSLDARAKALQARAARLNGPVIDPATLERLKAAIAKQQD